VEENTSNFSLVLLIDAHPIKPFDCEDSDLNEFLFEKAKDFKKEFLATTFLIESESRTVAYYSIFHDSLSIEEQDFASKSSFKKFLKNMVSHPKRHLKSFPALKIGRLGIDKEYKGKGLGKKIVSYIISETLNLNDKQACKLITVDAYRESIGFYRNMGFEFLTSKDEGEETRQMFFDLSLM
jgi:GNAT superfamily N-acetyltransferase